MTSSVTTFVTGHNAWLSQGDIFERLPVVRVGVRDDALATDWAPGPAILVSHACAIDKKSRSGRSTVEYLSFLPIQDLSDVDSGKAQQLRTSGVEHRPPYAALYLGDLPVIGEAYAPLVQPYTLPALILRVELQDFTAEQTGKTADRRLVATVNDTRVATLTAETLHTLHWKWTAQWIGRDINGERVP